MDNKSSDQQGTAAKRSPLESLSKDELISKYTGLRTLALKAKQAHNECQEDNKRLTEKLSQMESQKHADKECLKAMQEIVDSLTENKLQSTIHIQELQQEKTRLLETIQDIQLNMSNSEDMSIENEALKRQINRLTEENEELFADLQNLEKKMEENSENEAVAVDSKKITDLDRLVAQLKAQIVEAGANTEQCKAENAALKEKCTNFDKQFKELIKKTEVSTKKMEMYKVKLIEISNKLKALKSTKKVLLEVVKDYAQTIPKWQKEILNASNKVFERLSFYEKENRSLKAEIEELREYENTAKAAVDSENYQKQLEVQNNEELSMKLKDFENNLEKFKETDTSFSNVVLTNEELERKIKELEKLIDTNRQAHLEERQSLVAQVQAIEAAHEDVKSQLLSKSAELETLNAVSVNKSKELEKLMETSQIEKKALTVELDSIRAAHEDIKNKLHEKTTAFETLEASLAQFKNENKELLEELKEINQVLKERGEVISRQMAKIQQLEKVNAERTDNSVKLEQMSLTVRDKDAEITQLAQELYSLRDKFNMSSSSMADNQSEILSTSTISRADEGARLREIEDSFEEKYFKLKSLAVRLKKKNTDLAAQIIKLETTGSRKDGVAETNGSDGKIVETLQKENEVLQKKVVALEAAPTEKTGGADNSAFKEYQSQLAMLKKEKEAFNLAKKDMESEIQKLKVSIKAKDQEIQDGVETQKTLRTELEKLKLTAKKTNVLNLEMDAYEKSLNDINAKLKAKKIHCDELEGTIDAQTKSIEALKNQIKLLEDSLDAEKQHSKEQKHQLDTQQSKLRESEHDKAELGHQLEQETTNKERLQLELDDSRLELSKAMADREKLCGSLETDKNKLTKQVYSLEDELETVRLQFKEKEQECEDIKTEFASYKIRAQSVLRNQTTRDTGRDQELAEEVTMMQQSIEKANLKLTAQQESIGAAAKNLEELQSDKQRLQARCKELMELIEESRVQNEHLMEEAKKQTRDHQDSLKSQRLQYETLNNCYKQQIKDLEETHIKELENLSKRPITLASANPTPGYPVNSDEHKINLILMEREEGEGSESSQQQQQLYTAPLRKISSSSRGKRDLMPLDELLNTSIPDESVVDSGEYDRPVSPTIELKQTHAQLQVQESRVKHLTALLAEAEQDLARLTQLNELLKEEVRRQERSLERSAGLEQHVHNSEYLKNVIFKFLTLNSCDEKTHLVPVLNTILKLSPDETQKLQNVAKGGESGGGPLGWAGRIWSSGGN